MSRVAAHPSHGQLRRIVAGAVTDCVNQHGHWVPERYRTRLVGSASKRVTGALLGWMVERERAMTRRAQSLAGGVQPSRTEGRSGACPAAGEPDDGTPVGLAWDRGAANPPVTIRYACVLMIGFGLGAAVATLWAGGPPS